MCVTTFAYKCAPTYQRHEKHAEEHGRHDEGEPDARRVGKVGRGLLDWCLCSHANYRITGAMVDLKNKMK